MFTKRDWKKTRIGIHLMTARCGECRQCLKNNHWRDNIVEELETRIGLGAVLRTCLSCRMRNLFLFSPDYQLVGQYTMTFTDFRREWLGQTIEESGVEWVNTLWDTSIWERQRGSLSFFLSSHQTLSTINQFTLHFKDLRDDRSS